MKPKLYLFSLAALILSLAAGCQTKLDSTAAMEDGRVDVAFQKPEDFTDFKDGLTGTDRGREDLEYQIRRAVAEEAVRYLKEGQKLAISFTDIDLAGDYLPSAHTGYDIRVIKSIYAPRMVFSFRLTDASGNVVREGEEKLHDTAFQYRSGIDRNEALFYDKEMLRDWLRKELGRV